MPPVGLRTGYVDLTAVRIGSAYALVHNRGNPMTRI
jgi:hypothetical protein